jgi:hypothetical protein
MDKQTGGADLAPENFGNFDDPIREEDITTALGPENTHQPVPEERDGYFGLDKLLSDLISQPKEAFVEQTRSQQKRQKQSGAAGAKYEERYFNRFVYALKSPSKSNPGQLT